MRPGGGKAKGSSFERQVCRDLSLWVSNGERDDLYWRSAMSGGRASVQFKKGGKNLTQTGDITAIDPLGAPLTSAFLVECKFYRDLILVGLFHGIKTGISSHWTKCVEQAKQHNKLPMLIARQNRVAPMVVLDQDGINFFGLTDLIATFHSHAPTLSLVWYDNFLKQAPPPK